MDTQSDHFPWISSPLSIMGEQFFSVGCAAIIPRCAGGLASAADLWRD
jgi:hypothetical protein